MSIPKNGISQLPLIPISLFLDLLRLRKSGMTSAPESIFTFYRSEMDPQVNNPDNSTSDNKKTPTITWHSLPQNPENLPEMQELILLFQQAAGEIGLIKKVAVLLRDEMKAEKPPEWLNSAEVLEVLRISKRTLQEYRDKKRIEFAKMGGRIYYNRRAVMGLLKKDNCN